jgi:hypothetical protein
LAAGPISILSLDIGAFGEGEVGESVRSDERWTDASRSWMWSVNEYGRIP